MASAMKGVTLYTAGTPNGWKPAILLKELNVPFTPKPIDLSKNEQKEPFFLKITPNGRIPALVDHDNGDYTIWQSGAILMYIADKYGDGKFYPKDLNKRHEVNQWLMFQMSELGPMQGQSNWFHRYAPEKIELAQNRYLNETKRLYSVLESQLQNHDYLAADEYTIADMATYPWVYVHKWSGIPELDPWPKLKAYMERIAGRPAVQEGMVIPNNFIKEMLAEPGKLEAKIKETEEKMAKKD